MEARVRVCRTCCRSLCNRTHTPPGIEPGRAPVDR